MNLQNKSQKRQILVYIIDSRGETNILSLVPPFSQCRLRTIQEAHVV
jgi:hypothetical protein